MRSHERAIPGEPVNSAQRYRRNFVCARNLRDSGGSTQQNFEKQPVDRTPCALWFAAESAATVRSQKRKNDARAQASAQSAAKQRINRWRGIKLRGLLGRWRQTHSG